MKTVVIYHRADFDGLFCREIARKFLGDEDVEYIGWDFGDEPIPVPTVDRIYIMDLPVDRVFGFNFTRPETIPPEFGASGSLPPIIWIDHHKSSIDSHLAIHPAGFANYCINGVAACRLAYQWFWLNSQLSPGSVPPLPDKQDFIDRKVNEPYAVQLAGEYDIWDKRNPDAETFQFGLRSQELLECDWRMLLDPRVDEVLNGTGYETTTSQLFSSHLLQMGHILQRYQQEKDASMVKRGFLVTFEGVRFLALNTAFCNSLTFAARDIPETGHEALMGFYFNGEHWKVSLYSAKAGKDLDLSEIAVRYGGGGHRGACGFQVDRLPFLNGRDVETLADKMYSTYCIAVGGKAFNGDPLPTWEAFRNDSAKTKQSNAWVLAAIAAL